MVKRTSKLAILTLTLSVWAWPLMICALSDSALTAEEQECCRAMADQCGQMEMPASHSCCKVSVHHMDSYLLKARFTASSSQSISGYLLPQADNLAILSIDRSGFLKETHSPPLFHAETISILRI